MAQSTYQHLIATNAENGKASFWELPTKPLNREFPFGTVTTIYSNSVAPPDVSFNAQADLKSSAKHSQTGMGRLCPDDGFASSILILKPGAASPMHRTRTVDFGVVVEGEAELHLDNNEVRTLRKGDTIVIRGAMHKWVNSSQEDVKMFTVVLDAKPIIGADGKEMVEEGL